MNEPRRVDAWDAHNALEQGAAVLVDVRTPVEYRAMHAAGAVNVPLDAIDARTIDAVRNGHADAPVYFICRTGQRAAMACRKLAQSGAGPMFVVEGGTDAWESAGLAVARGKKAMSLERQVRIAAGSIVAAGTLLAAFVHPWFWVVPAFIGSGLVFSGVTDTCGMGMILARMPWNHSSEQTCTS